MDNGWVQTIVGSLIVGSLTGIFRGTIKSLVMRRPIDQLMIGVGVASVVFMLGFVLQPAVEFVLQGASFDWLYVEKFRGTKPFILLFSLFFSGLIPGIPTAFVVVKGTTLKSRMTRGVICAPFVLLATDGSALFLCWYFNIVENLGSLISWHYIYFAVLSDIFGGIGAGIIIGSLVHVYCVVFSGS